MKKIFFFLFSISLIISCKEFADPDDLSSTQHSPTAYTFSTPKDWGLPDIPADNPMTQEGIELGRRLFYDPILSKDSTISCGSCHNAKNAFTDGKAVSNGINGLAGKRGSMSLVNMAFNKSTFFWDGRSPSLEKQALLPVEEHTEMGEVWENVIKKIVHHKDYPAYFRKAFPITKKSEITKEMVVKAIAQFERSIISKDSRYDKFLSGKVEFTDNEQFGYDMFFNEVTTLPDAQCGHCHSGRTQLMGNGFFNNGLQEALTLDNFKENGYGDVIKVKNENGKFRGVTLRNIELSAPYMHDGSFKTLNEVMEHYKSGGKYSPNKDPLIQQVALNAVQTKQVIAFLKTLTDSTILTNKAYQNPFLP